MYICIEGCAHGDLDKIYSRIAHHETEANKKVDLLICCGDFQATRNTEDLACMAVPQKYLSMETFYKYYTGQLVAPVLTIFIGGNHEASNHLQELAYGGWVAPKIFYLGYAGVININGIRIGGISGIYKEYNYRKGHFECPPYNDNTVRSVYSVRNLEVFRLSQLKPSKIDVMISHDWPQKIWEYGDKSKRFGSVEGLLRLKPDFRRDMSSGKLGNPPCLHLLKKLKPQYWYSAHMHCRFDAIVPHNEGDVTNFTALDKCLPGRNCFEFLTIGDQIVERDDEGKAILKLQYDAEWLAVLMLTNKFLNCSMSYSNLPAEDNQSSDNEQRCNFTPTEDEIQVVLDKFKSDLTLPQNFKQTVNGYNPEWDGVDFRRRLKMPSAMLNIQTTEFCEKLGIDDPLLIASNLNNVKVCVPNYQNSDQEAFTNCNLVSEKGFSVQSKPQLSLPKPINDEEINLDDLEDELDESKMSTRAPETKDLADEEQQIEVQTKTEEKLEPMVKKFKRRNQEIYNDEEN